MSLRDRKTPLTDKARWDAGPGEMVVSESFARRLEQERDAAVEALKEAKKCIYEWGSYTDSYRQRVLNLQGDLDKIDTVLAEIEKE